MAQLASTVCVTLHVRRLDAHRWLPRVGRLLGPNGAGKTTLISTLTGMFAPSQGYARVAGLDIATQMSAIHQVIGICPQFDVHFPTMTVREHLLLYARLKGVPSSTERSLVDAMIEGVGLCASPCHALPVLQPVLRLCIGVDERRSC